MLCALSQNYQKLFMFMYLFGDFMFDKSRSLLTRLTLLPSSLIAWSQVIWSTVSPAKFAVILIPRVKVGFSSRSYTWSRKCVPSSRFIALAPPPLPYVYLIVNCPRNSKMVLKLSREMILELLIKTIFWLEISSHVMVHIKQ